jgi:hypothetical protein
MALPIKQASLVSNALSPISRALPPSAPCVQRDALQGCKPRCSFPLAKSAEPRNQRKPPHRSPLSRQYPTSCLTPGHASLGKQCYITWVQGPIGCCFRGLYRQAGVKYDGFLFLAFTTTFLHVTNNCALKSCTCKRSRLIYHYSQLPSLLDSFSHYVTFIRQTIVDQLHGLRFTSCHSLHTRRFPGLLDPFQSAYPQQSRLLLCDILICRSAS